MKSNLPLKRRFVAEGNDPYESVEWDRRTARIEGDGGVVFEQADVEVPKYWSQLALNVVASKYFRGKLGTPERETSVKQLVSRVVDQICLWALKGSYLRGKDLDCLHDELVYMILNQMMAFNSPVWFNLGVEGVKQQTSACFVLDVNDNMESIMDLAKTEAMLFKGGSGAGSNLSRIRGSNEGLAGGGGASGPVSFMKGYDAFAGVVKSGGKTRRAAVLRCLDDDHPDLLEFIQCKMKEEKKAHALIEAGFDGGFNVPGGAYDSVAFQNANHSVRLSDEFMYAVEQAKEQGHDGVWALKNRTNAQYTAEAIIPLWNAIGEAAWFCGDPGVQFDTTINEWHTCPNTDKIRASNPCCFTGDTRVVLESGQSETIREIASQFEKGYSLPRIKTLDASGNTVVKQVTRAWISGITTTLWTVITDLGHSIQCTPEHVFILSDGSEKQARHLKLGDILLTNSKDDARVTVSHRLTFRNCDGIPVFDLEVEDVHRFSVTSNSVLPGLVVHNSEYMFLDDSACNLASLNLMKFYELDTGEFDHADFVHCVQLTILAQEIMVGFSSYPTEAIARNSHDYRPLGLGYANLGALLMAKGLAYDSEEGRRFAASVTSLMTGAAYRMSSNIAQFCGGPFAGYEKNREPFLEVIKKHQKAVHLYEFCTDVEVAGMRAWEEAVYLGERYGFRNAQCSTLAPTGTIGFMMDCDTLGVEPDIALVKYKSLVGGGKFKIVNQTIPAALERLGYNTFQQVVILEYLEKTGTIEGAPFLKEEHLPVFDCAFKPANGERSIGWMGHIKMMGAVQPFISGAISKTVNMPANSTVEDVQEAYYQSWKQGLKAVAIYRDGCKRTQPLNTSDGKVKLKVSVNTEKFEEQIGKAVSSLEELAKQLPPTPKRKKLPSERSSITKKLDVGGHEGYLTCGLYEDGTLGEIFIVMSKEGSTMSGLLDSFATAVSMGLQYGVPLEVLVDKFSHTRFEPAGFTGDPNVPIAKSIVDYIFRWLEHKFLGTLVIDVTLPPLSEVKEGESVAIQNNSSGVVKIGVSQADVPLYEGVLKNTPNFSVRVTSDGQPCSNCGTMTYRNGSCMLCPDCGTSSGCS